MRDPFSTPRNAFVGLKAHPQGSGGRKGFSGHAEEHKQALIDNAAWDAQKAFADSEPVNELANTIGGISETDGLPTDDGSGVGI